MANYLVNKNRSWPQGHRRGDLIEREELKHKCGLAKTGLRLTWRNRYAS
jgi:hypothetical protein